MTETEAPEASSRCLFTRDVHIHADLYLHLHLHLDIDTDIDVDIDRERERASDGEVLWDPNLRAARTCIDHRNSDELPSI